jgi:hypothetical protein
LQSLSYFSVLRAMIRNFIGCGLFFLLLLTINFLQAQCLPQTPEAFFSKLRFNNQLPERLLSGRTVLFYGEAITQTDLEKTQASFAGTGIDVIVSIELEKLLAGQEVRMFIFKAVQKRELSNLVFLQKTIEGYRCIITAFNKKSTFTSRQQSAWQATYSSLYELLLQVNREALSHYRKQNLLINEQPDVDFPITLVNGSRMESYTSDLRADRVAVRLSGNEQQDGELKEVCKTYPFKMEFVADSISDADLRQRGFWYVLNCIYATEYDVRFLLGYPQSTASVLPAEKSTFSDAWVYKFYFRKLEYDHLYMGKQWDAAPSWQQALRALIANLPKT